MITLYGLFYSCFSVLFGTESTLILTTRDFLYGHELHISTPWPKALDSLCSPDVLEKVWPAIHDSTKVPMTKRTQIIIMNTVFITDNV